MKTIREIAEEIGVTKQAIQKRISRKPLHSRIQNYLSKIGNRTCTDETGEMLIKQAFQLSKSTTKSTTVYTVVHDEIIQFLQEQLRVKDKQIAELTATVRIQAGSAGRKYQRNTTHSNDKQISQKCKSVPIDRLIANAKNTGENGAGAYSPRHT